jgi:hypothetical protein
MLSLVDAPIALASDALLVSWEKEMGPANRDAANRASDGIFTGYPVMGYCYAMGGE